MPRHTTADHDLVIELSQDLLTRQAALTLALSAKGVAFGAEPDAAMSGVADFEARLAYLWLDQEPNTVGSLHRTRSSDDRLSIVLDLVDTAIEVRRLRAVVGGEVAVLDLAPGEGRIPVVGRLEITDRVVAVRRPVRYDRVEAAAVRDSWCALVDLGPDPVNGDPQIELRLDETAILQAPLVVIARIEAYLDGYTAADGTVYPPGSAAGDARGADLVAQLKSAIAEQVRAQVTRLSDWRLDGAPGLLPLQLLPCDHPGDPANPTELKVRTLGGSLYLLVRTIGPGGDPQWISHSQLEPGEGLALTVANRALIGGIVRGALIKAFPGLTDGSFVPGFPCWVITPATITPKDQAPYQLKSLLAGVSEHEQVVITGTLHGSAFSGGVTYDATFELVLTVDARVEVVAGRPKLRILPAVVRSGVTHCDAWVEPWVYVVFGLATGGLMDVVFGIIDAVAEGEVRGKVTSHLGDAAISGLDQGLPGGLRLAVGSVSLHQDDASLEFAPLPGLGVPVPSPYRSHDLAIGVRVGSLGEKLVVSCRVPDEDDLDRRIDAIGGVLADGTRWGMTIDEAVAIVGGGRIALVVGTGDAEVPLIVATSVNGLPYLRTLTDPDRPNLGDLADC